MVKKEKQNKEKLSKKDIVVSKEDLIIESLKSKIELEKIEFNRYVDTLVRSAFMENCTGGSYFNNLFHELLKNGYDKINKSSLSQKDKDKIRDEWFFDNLFKGSKNEKEKLEKTLKYWKSLNGWAECELENLNEEIKKKIIIDSIEQKKLWSDQFDRNSNLYKLLEEKTKNKNGKKRKTKQK